MHRSPNNITPAGDLLPSWIGSTQNTSPDVAANVRRALEEVMIMAFLK
jgi:hypothetical protein